MVARRLKKQTCMASQKGVAKDLARGQAERRLGPNRASERERGSRQSLRRRRAARGPDVMRIRALDLRT
jgi:hypothetical protein